MWTAAGAFWQPTTASAVGAAAASGLSYREAPNNPPSELARLRRTNRELTDQIEVAVAHLQRLTLENHTLREELEHSRKITRLPRAQLLPPAPPT
jgi:hypothetical protein